MDGRTSADAGDNRTPYRHLEGGQDQGEGQEAHIPVPWAMAPASHANAEPPATDAAFIKPMALGTSRAWVSCGVTAIVVGKTGPRKKPSTIRATLASAAAGDSQARTAAAVTPARQVYTMPVADAPTRAAAGLIRNRPRVSPSQYPLMEYPATWSDSERAWTK